MFIIYFMTTSSSLVQEVSERKVLKPLVDELTERASLHPGCLAVPRFRLI
jgi:hypothetical protein